MGTRLLKKIDLLQGVSKASLKNLTLPDMELTVLVEIDKELEALIDKGKEGLRWQQLADAADAYVAKPKKTIAEELKLLNDKVETLSKADAERMVETTAKLLKQIAVAQEAGVNAAVEDVWAQAVRRNKNLSKFKTKCVTKALVGALTISTSLASMIASGGANLLGVMVIFKTVAELGLLVGDIAQSVEEAASELAGLREDLIEKIAKDGQPSRKGEVISDLSPIIQKLTGTVKTVDISQVKLDAKIAALEKNADTMVASLNAGLDKLLKLDTKNPAHKDLVKQLADGNKLMLREIQALNKNLEPYRKFTEQVRKEVLDWKAKRQPKTAAAIKAASFAKLAVGLLSATRTFGKIAGLPIP
jgi:hypothetical protein